MRLRPLPFAASLALGSALLAACAASGAAGGPGSQATDESEAVARTSLFDATEVLALRLEGPFDAAMQAAAAGEPDGMLPGFPKRTKDPFAGTLTVAGKDGTPLTLPVELKVRGNSSLQECAFAKLSLKIPKEAARGKDLGPFAGDTKVKLGTHCGESATGNGRVGRLRHELAAHREAAVYALLGALVEGTAAEPALHARAVRVTYVDTTPGAERVTFERDGFLLEAADRLARRLGAGDFCRDVAGEEQCDPVLEDAELAALDPAALPVANAALLGAFHAMVGNWDFSLGAVAGSSNPRLWNTDVLAFGTPAAPRYVPLAQDFDLATGVTADLRGGAVERPTAAQLEAQAADFLARLDVLPPAERTTAVARTLARREAIEAALAKAPLDAVGRANLEAHLAAYYAVVAR